MSLELYNTESAKLNVLLAQLANTSPTDAMGLQDARRALIDFRGMTSFGDLEDRAEAAVNASITAAAMGFAAHLSSVTAHAEDLAASFKAAADIAQAGEDDLLMNRINGFLDRTVKTVEAGMEAVEKLRDLGKITPGDASDAIARIEAAKDAWEGLKAAVES